MNHDMPMPCITTFVLVNVLGALAIFLPSLFQKIFLEHLFRARPRLGLGERAVNKTHTVSVSWEELEKQRASCHIM